MARSLGALLAFSLPALALTAGHALAAPIPPPVRDMIEAAGDDPAKLNVVAEIARKTNPDARAEIDALVAFIRDDAEKVRVATLSSYTLRQGWTGQGEAGGSLATGNTDESGITVGLNLNKETVTRRHRLTALVDSKTAGGVQTTERYSAGYQGDFKFTERTYSNVLVGWERDPFAGLDRRFSESLGVGYRLLQGGPMTLDVDVGVAARQTHYADGAANEFGVVVPGGRETSVGARLGARYEWKLSSDSVLTNIASAYLDSQSNTVESATAITTKLIGHLSWRGSFNVRYESAPPPPREQLDTLTRLSLVYAF
ncbi:MAG: DUF481 domain-containing protein [Caulobacterales bacterium]|nr:DUF481 domain-containing protein [Caulobacterales bacterium]